jgi:predicted RNase H-like HicB family nuclease
VDPRINQYLSREPGFSVSLGFEMPEPDGAPLYAAWLTDFPGCISQGPTETEAVTRLVALAPTYLEKILQLGLELPTEPPALIPGHIRFCDPKLGCDPAIAEPRRIQKNRQEATSPQDASTATASPAAA